MHFATHLLSCPLARLLLAPALLLAGPALAQTPVLTGRAPAPNTSAAPVAGPITATFSQPLNPATVGGVRVHSSLRQGRRVGTTTASGNTLSFQPAVPFLPGEQVSVTLPASVQGAGGAGIAPQVYQLRTATGGPGEGRLLLSQQVPLGNTAIYDLLAGDLDGDGDVDAIANDFSGQLRVYSWMNGALTPGPVITQPTPGSNKNLLLDADNDGDLDLLMVYNLHTALNRNDGAGNFAAAVISNVAGLPTVWDGLATDLDGDGDQDLVVLSPDNSANSTNTNKLHTLLNDGSGQFTLHASSASLTLSLNLGVSGDVDRDGDPDVVVSNFVNGQSQLTILHNDGTGVLAAPVVAAAWGDGHKVMHLLDLNGDQYPDAVLEDALPAPNSGQSQQSVSFGGAGGTFSAPQPMFIVLGEASSVVKSVFGDLDGDGDLDCTYRDANGSLNTALNNGQGVLTPAFSTASAVRLGQPWSLADYDGDQDLDLLTWDNTTVPFGQSYARSLLLYRNEPVRPYISGFNPARGPAGTVVTITGLNLDTTTDVYFNGVAATVTSSSATTLTAVVPAGASSGPLTARNAQGTQAAPALFLVDFAVRGTAPAANAASGAAAPPPVLTLTEPATASSAASIQVSGSMAGPRTVAVSGGGTTQLSLAPMPPLLPGELLSVTAPASVRSVGGNVPLTPYVWQFYAATGGTGTGTFQPGYSTLSAGTNGPKTVLAADLNHDSYPDLVALQPDAPDENVLVALNLGTGTGAVGTPTLVPIGSRGKALALADVNQDGHLDLLTTSQSFNNNTGQNTGYLNVRLGTGTGGFAATATSLVAGISPYSLAVGDVNNDGLTDVVAADYTAGNLLTFLGSSAGLSAGQVSGSVDSGPTDVALADVNNDGRLDALAAALFVGNANNPGRVSVRLGAGTGAFTAGGTYASVDAQTSALVVGDLNNDHFVDIVSLANRTGGGPYNSAQVSLGTGSGSFVAGQRFTLNGTPFAGTLGDIDADGDLDVLVASGNRVQVLRNDGGTLTLRPDAAAGNSPQQPALADLDNDGDLDLAVANYGSGNLAVRLNTPGTPPPPTISSFSPTTGPAGTLVTVNGTGFNNTSDVSFNGLTGSSVTVLSNFQLTVQVPYNATTGPLTVTTPGGTATSTGIFTAIPAPSITSFSPMSGPVGTVVSVSGNNFSGATAVSFNALAASFTVISDTQISATVPAGVTSAYIQVTTPGGQASSSQPFNVSGLPPSISGFGPGSGPVSTIVSVYGSGFSGLTEVRFNGTRVTAFLGPVAGGSFTVRVPAGATTGKITVVTPNGTATSLNDFTVTGSPTGPAPANDLCNAAGVPTLSCGQQLVAGTTVGATATGDPSTGFDDLTPSAAAGGVFYKLEGSGATVTAGLCGSTYAAWGARLFVYKGSCGELTAVAADANSCGNTFPKVTFATEPGTTYYLYVNGAGSAQGAFLLSVDCSLQISSNQIIPAGTYQNLIIGPEGSGTLGGPVLVQNQLQVQPGGTLLTACQPLSGSGSFDLGSGATLGICDASGLGLPGAGQGAVQLSGTFTLSPEANYLYNGTGPQQTGLGLPGQARALLVQNAAGLTLSQALRLSQLLRLSSGDLRLNGQLLTLLSGEAGTALIDNTGGQVLGNTGLMQRWISPATNPLTGYRHFSSPVSGSPVQQLTTPGYSPMVNKTYNLSATPNTVQPFPTIFGYDEQRLSSSPAVSYGDFDKGWVSPTSLTETLTPGRGYTVQLPPSALSSFKGSFTTGTLAVPLTRGPQAAAGWHLLGNPYPAPIDWDAPGGLLREGVADALYVSQSLSAYTGQYRAYVNGLPAGNNLIAAGQGFFVRVAENQTAGTFTFTDAARLTEFTADEPALYRGADPRPRLRLQVAAAARPALADETHVYFEAGATAGFDAHFDAYKLLNTGNSLNLATTLGGTDFAINGLPVRGAPAVLPLRLQVPQAGNYVFEARELVNFAAGQTVVLRDALTNTRLPLAAGTRYAITLAGTDAPGRFALEFALSSSGLATTAAATADWQVFPNPSREGKLRLVLPLAAPLAAGAACTAELRDALGRLVRPLPLARPGRAQLLDQTVDVSGLPTGVYLLHLRVGEQSVVRRVALE